VNDLTRTTAQMLDAYKTAVHDRNVSAFMDLYAPDAQVFDTWAVWSYESNDARRPTIEEWFGSLGTDRVKVSFEDVQATTGPELAVVTAIGTYAAISPEGVELRSMQNRFTWVLRNEAGIWKIIHEHTSMPIGFPDAKAIFHREAN
jgi:uncharacterized protein (TIGR02246 family)